ncbi:DUF1697 domain-containing protein [Rhizobium sp. S-51]|uniref:DUF1697 domain-containing protein n=1 Tax=Rhizobium terricola TaxID=2728849 RepID=A0A7Y0B0I3_9HYPH|nr:DUF1697 domain-containing protein [Rhizobium terricola]NML76911.1 DUF1697 domain-containing protein [Rhizobium terricola]
MPVFVALLRAINVGGTGKLPMAELKALAEGLGFAEVSTYIQSGNLIFRDGGDPAEIAARLNAALGDRLGKAPGVFLRTPVELRAVLDGNPFAAMAPERVLVSFFGKPPGDDALHGFLAPDGEEAVVRGREIYVHYPIGSGRSKIRLPALKAGTARNINTVARLAELATGLEGP